MFLKICAYLRKNFNLFIMKEKLIKQLGDLNFSEKEAAVYVSLAETGQTSAGKIIQDTGYHRNVVYTALDKLINNKLAFKIRRKNIAYFQITDPAQLRQNAQQKLETSTSVSETLSKYLDSSFPEITIHEGIEAYRNYWCSAYTKLPVGSINYVAGSIGDKWLDFMGDAEIKMQNIRRKKKIVWKLVVFDKNDFETNLIRKEPRLNQFRLIDKKEASKDGNFNVFNDEYVVLHSLIEPMIIEIKSKSLAKVFKNIFDLLWEQAKPLK